MLGELLAIQVSIVGGTECVDEEARGRRAADGGEDRVRAGDGLDVICHAVASNKLYTELIELRSACQVNLRTSKLLAISTMMKHGNGAAC